MSNPFKVAWDAGMQIREVIQRELHRKVYVVVVVVFPDMEEPDPGIEVWVANERVTGPLGVPRPGRPAGGDGVR